MGSSVVVLPYGFATCGLAMGVGLCFILGAMCLYTCLIYMKNAKSYKEITDFSEYYFGKCGKYLAFGTSVFVLMGALVAYYLLMRDSLYYIGDEVFHWTGISHSFWSEKTACYCIVVIFPVIMMKNLDGLIKINSVGFIFLSFIIFFICYHGIAAIFGAAPEPVEDLHVHYVAENSYAVLMGMLALGFFVHNGIFALTSKCDPKVAKRDVSISFGIVAFFYALVGAMGYFGFAYAADGVIEDNFLNIFHRSNVFALATRFCLFLQLFTVYPILMYIIRAQVFEMIHGTTDYPGFWQVFALNTPCFLITLIMSVMDVAISDVLRYTGSISALIIVFFMPVFVHWKVKKAAGTLNLKSIAIHTVFLVVSVYVVLVQFVSPN
eukprot:TRINITY_DN14280_c0_g2_i1.p1 TRINITY_DN14280_c0_g2~~TRINITY_DN14280_c0_g2_i1.p1  ORF type:complete len:442 (-),score=101.27 TRINITY_DN14280_c0_g2_i1:204-1340(-)